LLLVLLLEEGMSNLQIQETILTFASSLVFASIGTIWARSTIADKCIKAVLLLFAIAGIVSSVTGTWMMQYICVATPIFCVTSITWDNSDLPNKVVRSIFSLLLGFSIGLMAFSVRHP
jgi:hypothetical protein